MPMRCAICSQGPEVRVKVDQALAGGRTLRHIAALAGVSTHSVRYHRDNCTPLVPPEAVAPQNMKGRIDVAQFIDLLQGCAKVCGQILVAKTTSTRDRIAAASTGGRLAVEVLKVAQEQQQHAELRQRIDRLQKSLEQQQTKAPEIAPSKDTALSDLLRKLN